MLGTITFRDVYDKDVSMKFSEVADIAACTALATALAPYSLALGTQVTVSQVSASAGTPGVENLFDAVEQKAHIDFVNEDATELAKRSFSMKLPAPVSSNFEGEDDKGLRISDTVGAALATAIGDAKGITARFVRGHYKSDKTSKSV